MQQVEEGKPTQLPGRPVASPDRLPAGTLLERQTDGALCFRATAAAHYQKWASYQLLAVGWNLLLLAAIVGAYLPHVELEGYGPGWGLLNLWPFALLGVLFIRAAAWGRWGWNAWHVYPDRIEYQSGWRFLRRAKVRTIHRATLVLEQHREEDHGTHWDLQLRCPGGWWKRYELETTRLRRDYTREQLVTLAGELSSVTGWLFEERPLNS